MTCTKHISHFTQVVDNEIISRHSRSRGTRFGAFNNRIDRAGGQCPSRRANVTMRRRLMYRITDSKSIRGFETIKKKLCIIQSCPQRNIMLNGWNSHGVATGYTIWVRPRRPFLLFLDWNQRKTEITDAFSTHNNCTHIFLRSCVVGF